MKVVNKIAKAFFYIGLALYIVVQSYAVGLLAGGTGLALLLACWSAITKLPQELLSNLWLVYLLAGIPVGIYAFFYILKRVLPRKSKKHNKQDNGNH